ncbi:hypothetical protein ACPV5U_19130 [Vibrio mediterranei]
MRKIEQLSLSREQVLSAFEQRVASLSDRDLAELVNHVFEVKLNICGSFEGPKFTTNLDMVPVASELRGCGVSSNVSAMAKKVVAKALLDPKVSGCAAKSKARMMLINNGIYLSQTDFEICLMEIGGVNVSQ